MILGLALETALLQAKMVLKQFKLVVPTNSSSKRKKDLIGLQQMDFMPSWTPLPIFMVQKTSAVCVMNLKLLIE